MKEQKTLESKADAHGIKEYQQTLIIKKLIDMGQIDDLLKAVGDNGYSITPFMLEYLICCGFSNRVTELLSLQDVIYNPKIYHVLCYHWGVEKAEEFFIQNGYEEMIEKSISAETLMRHNYYETLLKRKEYEYLAKMKQFDLLLKEDSPEANKMLLSHCQIEDLKLEEIENHQCPMYINVAEDFLMMMPKYFSPEKVIDYLLDRQRIRLALMLIDLWKDNFEICVDNFSDKLIGHEDELYKRGFYKYLLEKQHYDVFIKNNAWHLFIEYYEVEQVNWQEYYNFSCKENTKKLFKNDAIKACAWNVLAAYGFRKTLLKNWQISWWFKSFFHQDK